MAASFLPDMAYTRRRFLISVGMIFTEWELGTAFHTGGSQKQNLNGFSVMKDRLETWRNKHQKLHSSRPKL